MENIEYIQANETRKCINITYKHKKYIYTELHIDKCNSKN